MHTTLRLKMNLLYKGKNLLSREAKYFLLEQTDFQKGLDVQKSKQKVEVVSLVKIPKIYHVYPGNN